MKLKLIFFSSGWVNCNKAVDYSTNRSKYENKVKSTSFRNAVLQMNEYIEDPIVSFY